MIVFGIILIIYILIKINNEVYSIPSNWSFWHRKEAVLTNKIQESEFGLFDDNIGTKFSISNLKKGYITFNKQKLFMNKSGSFVSRTYICGNAWQATGTIDSYDLVIPNNSGNTYSYQTISHGTEYELKFNNRIYPTKFKIENDKRCYEFELQKMKKAHNT